MFGRIRTGLTCLSLWERWQPVGLTERAVTIQVLPSQSPPCGGDSSPRRGAKAFAVTLEVISVRHTARLGSRALREEIELRF